jgi:O-antigen ligase
VGGIGPGTLPLLVLGASLGVAYAVVAARSLAAGLGIFAYLTFFDISPVDLLTRLAGVLLVGLWMLAILTRGNRVPLVFRDQPRVAAIVLLLAGWFAASTVWARDFDLAMTDAVRLLQGVVLILMIYTAIREPRHVRWLMIGFVAGALTSAALGIVGGPGRITGGFDDPNELAAVIVPGAILAAFGFIACRGRALRWALLATLPVFAAGLLDTDSQGGFVALMVGMAAAVAIGGPVRLHAAVVALTVGCLAFGFYLAKPPAPGQFTEGGESRENLWKVALTVARDHPLLGVGAGNFPVVEPAYALRDLNLTRADLVTRPEVAHNTYIHVLADYGSVGLLLFLSLIGGALATGLQAARAFQLQGDRELELLARGQLTATLAMLAAYFFQSGQFEKQLWLMLGFSVALRAVAINTYPAASRLTGSWRSSTAHGFAAPAPG